MSTPAPRRRVNNAEAFGPLLKRWRASRGVSQLDLALSCNTSQRHLSFLESGRSRPSRGMVLQLATALSVPLRHQNALMLAAGFAPAWDSSPLEAPEMAPVKAAITHMLETQAPFPAVVVDRHYNLIQANSGAQRLLGFLAGPAIAGLSNPNLVRLLLSPGMRDLVENWEEVAAWMIRRLKAEALLEDPLQAVDTDPFADLFTDPSLTELAAPFGDGATDAPTLYTRFTKDGVRLSLFSIIAMVGTPLDAGLQNLRVELFYPADEPTRAWFKTVI
ncbi:helix-turn-helix transcriptional regulator [Niveispirillum sp.]|uniref:helix-turn-helix domain-containing protein n=1 Tax=Niveispirillum sp. TaxID=1917217 RepID=UPI001B7C00CC|nr:helix-turn-helix transcriptional regulator [Niveispirillum sp.]MBP7340643.1 helix-turn-helix transcriptional regulator [Niveispirillum sp.]